MKRQIMIALLACTWAISAAADEAAPIVKLETVGSGNEIGKRVFFGRVVARETVDLAFQVGGQLVEFPVEEGATVTKDALVARLDREPFELKLAQATAQRAEADRAVDRYRELLGTSVSRTTLEDAETQAELAAIAVRNAERDLANATLHAPFDGIVAARLVSNYSTVAAGSPVVRLHDMSDLRIEIDVPETLVQRSRRDDAIEMVAEFPWVDRQFPMEMREFNAETAQTGQTYSITLGMAPPEGLNVLPGASAKVTAFYDGVATGAIVPASAIVVENDGTTSVMVFSPTQGNEGTVSRAVVEIEPTDDGKVRVVSGLTEGQEIVAIGAGSLTDGETVRRFVGFEE